MTHAIEDPDWIGRTYLSTFGWEVLEDIVDLGPRLGGSEGERRAQRRVQEAFREAGARQIDEHTFEVERWSRGRSHLHLEAPHDLDLDCIALPGSPRADLEGEFVYLEHGLPEDFESADLQGKIAVARSDVPEWYDHWMHRREKYGLAIRHGAEAFVFANHVEGSLAPTGSLAGGVDVIGDIPAVGVSKEVGAQIARYAARDDAVRGRLEIEAEIGETTSQNVTAVVGPETSHEVLVGAHVDGHDISQAAMDNGVGVATLCEVARMLGERNDTLETRVRLVGFGCEELGLVGSQHYAADHDVSDIDVVVNLDGLGAGRNPEIHTNRFDDLRPIVESVADEFRHPVDWVPEYVLHSDHWPFVWRGVPGLMFRADSDQPGRGFGHTTADTLDKVDIRDIRNHAIVATRLIERLAERDVDIARKSADEVEAYLRDQGAFEYLDRSGDWPY